MLWRRSWVWNVPCFLTGKLVLTPCLQVAAVSNLSSLQFLFVGYRSANLRQLTSLLHAAFSHCHLPLAGSLSELTQLEVLEVRRPVGPADIVASSLGGALRRLTQLTGLRLDDLPAAAVDLALLAPLARLQWLYLKVRGPTDGLAAAAAEAEVELFRGATLPSGPWQRSLRRLATSFQQAQQSLPFLAGAGQLEHLSFFQPPARHWRKSAEWRTFWRWAGEHAPLQHLVMRTKLMQLADPRTGNWEEPVDPALLEAALQLKGQRPALQIEIVGPSYYVLIDF